MMRVLLRDSVVYGLAAIFSRGLSILILPFYAYILSPEQYGVFEMLTTFGLLASLAVALEVTQAVARFYGDEPTQQDKYRCASTAWWFVLGMYTFFLVVCQLFADGLTGLVIGQAAYADAFRLGVAGVTLNSLFLFVQNQFRWELDSRSFAVLSVIYSVTMIAASLGLAWGAGLGLMGVLWGQALAAAFGLLLGLWKLHDRFALRPDFHRLRAMLRFSLPLVPASLAVFITLYINRWALGHLATLADVGLFGMAYRLAGVAGFALMGLQTALTPLVYAHYKAPETPGHLARLLEWFVAAALLLCLGLGLFAGEMFRLATPSTYHQAAPLVMLLAPSVLLGQMYIFAPGIALAKKTHFQLLAAVLGAVTCIGLNWLLIPQLGLSGAAWASLVSSLVFLGVWFSISQRLYPLPLRARPMVLAVLAAVSAALADHLLALAVVGKTVLWLLTAAGILLSGLVRRQDFLRLYASCLSFAKRRVA